MSNEINYVVNAEVQSILDGAENQIGDQVTFNWTRELRSLLESEHADEVREYMLSFAHDDPMREDYKRMYGFAP